MSRANYIGAVRSVPDHFDGRALPGMLADGWGFLVESAVYAPLGGGSYHWIVGSRDKRAFATVDDLDQKPWLGETRDDVFSGLRRAFDTALGLRKGGLEFVVAPLASREGESVRRVSDRHTLALFPLVDGRSGAFGRYEADERTAIAEMLRRLHAATPFASSISRRFALDLPSRRQLEAALDELDEPWTQGPLGEPARALLAGRAADVVELIAIGDRLRAEVAAHGADWVVTHGEPHAGNVMRTPDGFVLVDWDTVALAPQERDLWMLGTSTDRKVDDAAMDFFRLAWELGDLAAFTHELRIPHGENADTAKALRGIEYCLDAGADWF